MGSEPQATGRLAIRAGNLNFSARWETEAPRTIAVIRGLLPIRAQLIHCRWSGESTWIPFGDLRPDLDVSAAMDVLTGSYYARWLSGRGGVERWPEETLELLWPALKAPERD